MPAAAVIPAPRAYTNAVAVKKLVVGLRVRGWVEALHARSWSSDSVDPSVAGCGYTLPIRRLTVKLFVLRLAWLNP